MKYDLKAGIKRSELHVSKLVFGLIAVIAVPAGVAVPVAFAQANGYCGSSANGCQSAAAAGAQCDSGAGSGAFGAFGKGNNLGIAVAPGNGDPEHASWLKSYPGPGTDGYQTGLNNSSICGNRT